MYVVRGWREPASREPGPNHRCAFGVAHVRHKLFFCEITLPSATAFELAIIGKPPLRQRVPLPSNLIETDPALHGRH